MRTIRIFNTPWHIAHQHDLYKTPGTEWYQVVNSVRKWGVYRPRPANMFEVPYYEPGKYDLAVLHVDQQCTQDTYGKSRLYRELNEAIRDIPKIVINHGTPFWPEVMTQKQMVAKMRMLIGDNYMVVNSHRAGEMWGPMGRSSQVIIHGMTPSEWLDLPKEPRVVTMLSPSGLDRYYNRSLLLAVKDRLKARGIPLCQITVDWVAKDFDDYREFLGRSLIYFNPTLESPMPRSRTEAMFSGCCVITLPNHGAETFIQNGKNGFITPNNPVPIADLIEELLKNHYRKCVEIGQEGKKTANQLFHTDRFTAEWRALLERVLQENGRTL